MQQNVKQMKLFVVGESSGNPDDWSEWPIRALVIAGSADEAIALSETFGPLAVEVSFEKPGILFKDESGASDNL